MATNTAFGRLTMGLTMTAMLLGVGMLAPAASALADGTPIPGTPIPTVVDHAVSDGVNSVNEVTTKVVPSVIALPLEGCYVFVQGPTMSQQGYYVWVQPCPPRPHEVVHLVDDQLQALPGSLNICNPWFGPPNMNPC